jgi:hypothetical protein
LCYNRFIDWGNSVVLSPRQLRGFSFGELSMKLATAINANTYRAIVPTLKLADISSASLLDTLLANGVGTRKDAVPYVVFYVTQLPKVTRKPYEGQRGWTFGRGTAEQRRTDRILDNIFVDVEADAKKPKTSKKKDKVTKLVTAYQAMTAAEKRRFLASI